MCYYTTFPSEFSLCILLVSNFHDVELLMRIIALDNANATDALAETIHQKCSFLMYALHQQQTVP